MPIQATVIFTESPLRDLRRKRPNIIANERLEEVDRVLTEAGFELGDEGPVGARIGLRRDLLIEYLHAINDTYKQLWTPHLAALAKRMRLSIVEVYEVASFYHHFRIVGDVHDETAPVPPCVTVRVCNGLSCQLQGATQLRADLMGAVNGDVVVLDAPCIGRCEQAPACHVDQTEMGHCSRERVIEVVEQHLQRVGSERFTQDLSITKNANDYRMLRECASGDRTVEATLQTLEQSGLRGLGGAGFPAGRKWRIVRNEPVPRLMAINIDEGEPGTFKDRHYLETNPHQFIEGMLIAAWAVGIDAIYIYLRDEYHTVRAMLTRELAALKESPPISNLPHIELRRGAGAYICGEESAMIESIEGKRGIPRLRPPYVAQVGLFGRPTLEHNFETLYWVPEILRKGADWFANYGVNGRQGLRSFSVSGRVKIPGVKIAPAGITLQALLDEHCGGMQDGHSLYAYLPGGASGGILPATLANVPLDFDTLQPYGCFIGSAAIIVLSQNDRAMDAARNLMQFFEHESCGQCTPCRAGTVKANALIATNQWNRELLAELSQVMRDASICGLGQAAPNPVDCVIKYFPHELST
jgi:formate dehydrogenase beta subunit